MSATNKIFSSCNPIGQQGDVIGSINKFDRPNLLTQQVANELNTYRNWGRFYILVPPYGIYSKTQDKKIVYKEKKIFKIQGTKSLFNNINAVADAAYRNFNAPLLDDPVGREKMRTKNICTVKELVRASEAGEMGRAIYNYSDFMYCKQLGKIPNNYLITLRRFPNPCSDYISDIAKGDKLQRHMPDIGRMVTWIGVNGNQMSNILKYSYKMPWKELKSEIQEIQHGEAGGILGKILNSSDSTYQKQVIDGTAGQATFDLMKPLLEKVNINTGFYNGNLNQIIGGAPYNAEKWQTNYDKNKNYGPIDVIKKTWIRSDQEGLEFEHKFSLVFDYELRSYDGINGKAAFLDLLGNILATTYTSGKFWGGSVQYYGQHQSNLFANLPIFKSGLGLDNLKSRLLESYTKISDAIPGKTVAEKLGNVVKGVGKGFLGALLGGALNKLGRPQRDAIHSQLSDAPTGMWHVMIGNPKNPILSMGNLIIDNAEIEHYGPLGLDDFPTGIRVKVDLKHGKPRDTSAIERMYFSGDYRIYTPMGDKIETMYNSASDYKGQSNITFETINQDATAVANNELIKSTNMSSIQQNRINKYIKFFGTDNIGDITVASQEGMFGAHPPKKGNDK